MEALEGKLKFEPMKDLYVQPKVEEVTEEEIKEEETKKEEKKTETKKEEPKKEEQKGNDTGFVIRGYHDE